jgi:hypothetical protein
MSRNYNFGDEIRRSQIVGTFGVGSIKTDINNVSMICAGLNHWYKFYTRFNKSIDAEEKEEEYKIYDKRLEKFLDVDFFKEPPEWKEQGANRYTPVPYLRFPTYMYCTFNRGNKQCGKMIKKKPTFPDTQIFCDSCEKNGFKNIMSQVNLVASCQRGHIDEFPWYKWAHERRKAKDSCNDKNLRLLQLGGTGVKGQIIQCSNCGASEDLDAGYFARNRVTSLNKCTGAKPWLGIDIKEDCDLTVKGYFSIEPSLYQPILKSSLFIPIKSSNGSEELEVEFSQNPQIKHDIKTFEQDFTGKPIETVKNVGIEGLLIQQGGKLLEVLSDFSEEEIRSALLSRAVPQTNQETNDEPENDIQFKKQEHEAIIGNKKNKFFKLEDQDVSLYSEIVQQSFKKITLINSMLQTRALVGFTRNSPQEVDFKQARSLLWINQPTKPDRWLPAIQNYAEGLFLEFNKEIFEETDTEISERLNILQKYKEQLRGGFLKETHLSKELLFIHTVSHMLIKNLSFDAGYSAASIAERLYVDPEQDMYGVLIYTAQGDSESTMGGLASSGRPYRFNNLYLNSLKEALWCSTDPVCNEIYPKGSMSLNLGACYSCTLLPETSCELLNCFLDRGIVVGTQNNPNLGLVKNI